MNGQAQQRRRLGRYELLAEIASGGMGSVLLARLGGAGGFERLFAIKVMRPELTGSQQFVRMLLEEARVAAKIHHPNVVATVDLGQHESLHYIVMDYVDGFPLTRILDDASFSWKSRVRIVNRALLDVLSGLGAAHDLRGDDGLPLGLVHRDVSPQNVLLGTDGVGRLTDFGIARPARNDAARNDAARNDAARNDAVRGKASYLAPEQATEANVDRRADLWAVGVLLWEALTGARLFAADDEPATIAKVVSAPIESPAVRRPDVPADLEALCMRALDRDPSRRHGSARDMALELERVAKRSGLLADAHEVADLLQERFGSETVRRRRAIQRYVAALGPQMLPIGPDDLYDLPNLAEDASPTSGGSRRVRQPVGLATMPASRFHRATPAGTSSESIPPKARRLPGVLGLLFLFALGSVTTLFLIKNHTLAELAAHGNVAGATEVPQAQAVPAPRLASAPPEAVSPLLGASAAPTASSSLAPESPSAPPATADARAPVPALAPTAVRGKAAPRKRSIPSAPIPPEAAASALPVEENPYRFK